MEAAGLNPAFNRTIVELKSTKIQRWVLIDFLLLIVLS